jgi:HK97 family phage major capsid protein
VAYNNLVSRTNAQATIPEVVSTAILNTLGYESALLRLSRRVPNLSTNQTRLPVLSALPTAYFVNGDTGLKQTTEMAWANKYLNVEELAAIVPVPQNVVDDISYNIWDEVQPLLAQAIGRAVDAAAFFGTNKPSSWPTAIGPAAVAASAVAVRGTASAAAGGIATDIEDTMALVEASGYSVTGFATNLTERKYFRRARDIQGQRLLDFGMPNPGVQGGTYDTIDGIPVAYMMAGLWPSGSSAIELFAGDFQQSVVGVRKDITVDVFDQGVIQDNTGAIVYNLIQQDMIALRVTFRMAWQVANTINYQQTVEASRYPFAVLTAPA